MSHLPRQTLAVLATAKLDSARILLAARCWTDAYYLAGYAVEFALKAILARQFPGDGLPDRTLVQRAYTHDLKALMKLTRLDVELEAAGPSDEAFRANWLIVSQWSEGGRYEIIEPDRAASLVSAVGAEQDGVLAWIMRRS